MDIKLHQIEFENILESESEIDNFIESMINFNHSISQSLWILYCKQPYCIDSFSDLLHRIYERKTLQKFVKQVQNIKIGKIFEERSLEISQSQAYYLYLLDSISRYTDDFLILETTIRYYGHNRTADKRITDKRIKKIIRRKISMDFIVELEPLSDLTDYWTRMDIDPELVYVPWDSVYLII